MQKLYENKIDDQIKHNKDKIDNLLKSFGKDLNKVQDEFDECKRTASAVKQVKDKYLLDIEKDHEEHFGELEYGHLVKVHEQDKNWDRLKEEHDTQMELKK